MSLRNILIDADAFPHTDLVISAAEEKKLPVYIYANYSQNLERFESLDGVITVRVEEGRDSADFAIIQAARAKDIVLTGDTGLAAVLLEKGVHVLGPRGNVFNLDTIDYKMALRHSAKKNRRAGRKTKGPASLTEEDKNRFEAALKGLLMQP